MKRSIRSHVLLSFLLLLSFNCKPNPKKVTIIGTGYVGLIVGAGLADKGHQVICADIDAKKIADLKNGIMPIFEPGLEELVKKNANNISFTTDVKSAIKNSEIIMIAVGTPTKENYESDLRALHAVANTIGETLKNEPGYRVVCIKSTVPIGTNKKIKSMLEEQIDKNNFDMVSNPEFLRAGNALKDLYEKNPIVIGSDSKKALGVMSELYQPFVENGISLIKANDFATAEITKYAWNSTVALKVSYVNDLSRLCVATGGNIFKVVEGIGFGDDVLPFKNVKPGPGFGGSCLPKDTRAFVKMASDREIDFSIIKAAINSSRKQKEFVFKQVESLVGNSVKDKTIGVLGLSFKAGTDDIRKSPAILVINRLLEGGAKIKAYDPKATENMKKLFPNVDYCDSAYEASKDTEAIIALTDWRDIKEIDLKKISTLVKNKVIVDARNMFDPKVLKENGFKFANLGRR
ncbi:UDP-glucose dehydrogenase family protein [Candidatus Dependentiae bacterium]